MLLLNHVVKFNNMISFLQSVIIKKEDKMSSLSGFNSDPNSNRYSNPTVEEKLNLLRKACDEGNFALFEKIAKENDLRNLINKNGKTALHKTLRAYENPQNWIKCVEILIANNVDVNATDKKKNTALHKAIRLPQMCQGWKYTKKDIERISAEVIKILLNASAYPNVTNTFKQTPLYLAIDENHTQGLQLLLRHPQIIANIPGCPNLFLHLKDFDMALVDRLMELGVDPDVTELGNILHGTTKSVSVEATRLFLELGINPNEQDVLGITPLLIATTEDEFPQEGKQEEYANLVHLLLYHKANPNISDSFGNTPLLRAFFSANSRSIELLLRQGADPFVKDKQGRTIFDCLFSPINAKKIEKIEKIIDFLGSIGITFDNELREQLLEEIELYDSNKTIEKLKKLINEANKLISPNFKIPITEIDPPPFKSINEQIKFKKILQNYRNLLAEIKRTKLEESIKKFSDTSLIYLEKLPLHLAILNKNSTEEKALEIVAQLLKIEPSILSTLKYNILHVTAYNLDVQATGYYLKKGVNPHQKTTKGETPLSILMDMFAHKEKYIETIDLFLQYGANPNVTNISGRTLLNVACQQKDDKLVELLLKYKANPFAQWNEITVLDSLFSNGGPNSEKLLKILSLFESAGILIDTEVKKELVEMAKTKGSYWGSSRKGINEKLFGKTAKLKLPKKKHPNDIFFACEVGNLELLQKMLPTMGIDSRNGNQENSLHVAVLNGQMDCVKFLIKEKVDLHAFDTIGEAPLHKCVYLDDKQAVEMAKILLPASSNPNIKNKHGETLLHMALKENKVLLIKHLLQVPNIDILVQTASGDTLLHVLKNFDLDLINDLIAKGVDIHALNHWNNNILHLTCKVLNVQATKLFLSKDVNLNQKNNSGETPLLLAVQGSKEESAKGLEIIKELLEKGANPNIFTRSGNTPLFEACTSQNFEIVNLLLNYKADLLFQGCKGETIFDRLFLPAEKFDLEGVKKIIDLFLQFEPEFDANLCQSLYQNRLTSNFSELLKQVNKMVKELSEVRQFSHTKDELQTACKTGNELLFKMALANIDSKQPDYHLRTALHTAASHDRIEFVQALIEKGFDVNATDDEGNTALHQSVHHLPMVKLLLNAGANFNLKNTLGQTSLLLAFNQNIQVFNFLLEQKDINFANAQGQNALHIAVMNGQIECAKYLIEKGIDVHAIDKEGETVLHKAFYITEKEKITELLKLLPESIFKINGKNKRGETPLHLAARKDDQFALMLLLKIPKNETNIKDNVLLRFDSLYLSAEKKLVEEIPFFLKSVVHLNKIDKNGNTPLTLACKDNDLELVKLLLKHGADANFADKKGNPPLHLTNNLEVIQLLLEHNANPHPTLLHTAISNGQVEWAKFLIAKGIDVNAPDINGKSPFIQACFPFNPEALSLLLANNANPFLKNEEGHSILDCLFLNIKARATKEIEKILEFYKSLGIELGETSAQSLLNAESKTVLKYMEEAKIGLLSKLMDMPSTFSFYQDLFYLACQHGFTTLLDRILEKVEINCLNSKGQTALHIAVMHGQIECAKFLINKKIDCLCTDNFGDTALHKAAILPDQEKGYFLAKLLLENCNNINFQNKKGETILTLAINKNNTPILNLLLKRPDIQMESIQNLNEMIYKSIHLYDINILQLLFNKGFKFAKDQKTNILHRVIERGMLEHIKFFLENGFDPKEGLPLIHLFKSNFRDEEFLFILELLLKHGARLNCINDKEQTPLTLAFAHKSKIFIFLLKNGANPFISLGDPKSLDDLLIFKELNAILLSNDSKKMQNVAEIYKILEIPFNLAEAKNQLLNKLLDMDLDKFISLQEACQIGNLQILKKKLEIDEKQNTFEIKNGAALYFAVKNGHIECIKTLLENKNVDINKKYMWNTVTHLAAAFPPSEEKDSNKLNRSIITLLLNAKPDVDLKNLDGDTPIHIAIKEKNIYFLENALHLSQDINFPNSEGYTPLHLASKVKFKEGIELLLKQSKIKVDALMIGKKTPLFFACNDSDLALLLLQAGANPHHLTADKSNILHFCNDLKMTSHFIELGVNLNQENDSRIKPVMRKNDFPDKAFYFEWSALLIEKGADPNFYIPNADFTYFHDACYHLKNKNIELLIKKQANQLIRSNLEMKTIIDFLIDGFLSLSQYISGDVDTQIKSEMRKILDLFIAADIIPNDNWYVKIRKLIKIRPHFFKRDNNYQKNVDLFNSTYFQLSNDINKKINTKIQESSKNNIIVNNKLETTSITSSTSSTSNHSETNEKPVLPLEKWVRENFEQTTQPKIEEEESLNDDNSIYEESIDGDNINNEENNPPSDDEKSVYPGDDILAD